MATSSKPCKVARHHREARKGASKFPVAADPDLKVIKAYEK